MRPFSRLSRLIPTLAQLQINRFSTVGCVIGGIISLLAPSSVKCFSSHEINLCKLLNNTYSENREGLFKKDNLKRVIDTGTYALIDSLPLDPSHLTEKEKKNLFQKLGAALTQKMLPHRQVIGSYNGEISQFSYIVLEPNKNNLEKFSKTIFELGKAFNQESIILSSRGRVQLIFTMGPYTGKAYSGKGFKKNTVNNFSVIKADCTDFKNCSRVEQCIFIGEYNLNKNFLQPAVLSTHDH